MVRRKKIQTALPNMDKRFIGKDRGDAVPELAVPCSRERHVETALPGTGYMICLLKKRDAIRTLE